MNGAPGLTTRSNDATRNFSFIVHVGDVSSNCNITENLIIRSHATHTRKVAGSFLEALALFAPFV